jgi:flotillin
VEKQGLAEAKVIESKGVAVARGEEAHALAVEKQGTAEANVLQRKYHAEAKGIEEKAASMKLFDMAGKDHEEFKLRLEKDKEVALAEIGIQTDIARAQADIVGEALKHDKIVHSVTAGKAVDRMVDNSGLLTDVRESMLGDKSRSLIRKIRDMVAKTGIETADLKNLSVAALLSKMIMKADDDHTITLLGRLSDTAKDLGLGNKNAAALIGDTGK